MNRSSDVLFITEYIKNVLYFATVRPGKALKPASDTHYFCIDNELVYENYYSDFGPLNLGCVYKYCVLLNDKLKQHLNKQTIVHYTSIDPKKKANAAFLLGCYGVLYLSLTPKDALKPLLVHGQSYRPFQDATQGDSAYTISLTDCLQAIKKARELSLFNFTDFNYEEYDRLDKIHGGDLNWIVPGKFLAFIGPEDYSVSLYHPPDMYIDYFLENNVKIVIRLNKRMYDGNVFNNVGIVHYDLFFPDGSCPPRHILMKFLQIAEKADCAIAVHCKAGLGRTGSLIGCYLIKHYCMTAHEAIGWMRICRPGSVIGHQQAWLEDHESWLVKFGLFYRKRTYNDVNRLPEHPFGVYSVAEKCRVQRSTDRILHKSPPSPSQKVTRPDVPRQQSSKIRDISPKAKDDESKRDTERTTEEEEVFLTSCDLTVKPAVQLTQVKGCLIRNNTIFEEDSDRETDRRSRLKRLLRCSNCKPCVRAFRDLLWAISVRCARVAPRACRLCYCIDSVAGNKTEKEQYDWRVRSPILSCHKNVKRDQHDSNVVPRRASGEGEPRQARPTSRSNVINKKPIKKNDIKIHDSKIKNVPSYQPPITTFRSSNGPIIKSVNDAKNFLLKSSMYKKHSDKYLSNAITITAPNDTVKVPNYYNSVIANTNRVSPSAYNRAHSPSNYINTSVNPSVRPSTQSTQHRRRLGRSPSPPMRSSNEQSRGHTNPAIRMYNPNEQTRGTNTLPSTDTSHSNMNYRYMMRTDTNTLREALSRLKLISPRDGSIGGASIGAASLGARRDAPSAKLAPSVRSDERPIATQGDLLNSIKFQKRLRDTLQNTDKMCKMYSDKNSMSLETRASAGVKKVEITPRTNAGPRGFVKRDYSTLPHDKSPVSRSLFSSNRPASPKGPRSPHTPSFY